MEPRDYIPRYLERRYLERHPDLTEAARALARDEIAAHPERHAEDDHAQALLAYAGVRARLLDELERMEGLGDEAYETARTRLFGEVRGELARIAQADRLCVDARLTDIMLADVPLDSCINDLLKLEREVRGHLSGGVAGFSLEAPAYWIDAELARCGTTAAERTAAEPEVIGWLHTLEALSELCLASARYRAAASYARQAMRAQGVPTMAAGTLCLALARLEDEDGLFALASGPELDAVNGACAPWGPLQDSPWFLLARAIVLYKAGRTKAAARALRDFSVRCEGGAFFLLNPTYMVPYLPVRPAPAEAWKRSHQAVWEADGIIADTPEFSDWAAAQKGIEAISEDFARRYGF